MRPSHVSGRRRPAGAADGKALPRGKRPAAAVAGPGGDADVSEGNKVDSRSLVTR